MAEQGKPFDGLSFQKMQAESLNPKLLWDQACKFDGIDPKSKFVVFSQDNPYTARYNKAMKLFLMAEKYYKEVRK